MTTGRPIFREFETREALAAQLSNEIAALLAEAVEARGAATLAVSGGTTPALFFRALSNKTIDWPNVTITLVDERFVPETSPRSNAGLAKANLLQDAAAAAKFAGLYEDVADAETAALDAADTIRRLGLPLDAVVLGMGGDGHTASFFPDAKNLDHLLDAQNATLVSSVDAPSGGEPRLTLTMPPIIGARRIVLHIEGAEKRAVIDAVLSGEDKPIRHVLDHAAVPVQIFWAP